MKLLSLWNNLRHKYGCIHSWVTTWRTWPVFDWINAAEYYRSGKYLDAERSYKQGLEKHPFHPARFCAAMDLTRCLIAQEKYEAADKYLRRLSAELPRSRRVHTALFDLQLRLGLTLEAAWTLRRAARYIALDEELTGRYFYCVVDNGGPSFLLDEVRKLVGGVKIAGKSTLLIRAAEVRHTLETQGYVPKLLKALETMADEESAGMEVVLLAAEALLRSGKIASARRVLRKGMKLDSSYPRVLSLFAETYLRAGPFYQPDYALQLASDACRKSAWKSPREMHVLAEAYFHLNDHLAALATAQRAQSEGGRLLGTYRDAASL
ncbi:MAG: hypothetical protein KDD60_08235, partial [Bdellovibrionales bacterium]|nr:hypothetical protein [Bdellovibrionales bacterium]